MTRGEGVLFEVRRFLASAAFLALSLIELEDAVRVASSCFLVLSAAAAAAAVAAAVVLSLFVDTEDLRLWLDELCFGGAAK